MIELGGNITLHGFKDRDYAELIVVKKIVGRYARELSDKYQGIDALDLTLVVERQSFTVKAICTVKAKSAHAEDTESNLFVALDGALKKVVHILG